MNGSRKYLDKLFAEQEGICYLCGELMERKDASIDHVIPQKFGGKSGPKKAAHQICNSVRGHDLGEIDQSYYLKQRQKIEARLEKRTRRVIKKHIRSEERSKFWQGAGVIQDDTGKLFFTDSV